jgi:hypothetical protein
VDVLVRLVIELLFRIAGKPVSALDRGRSEWWKRLRSNGWPVVHGRVHSSSIYPDDQLWLAEVSYSYSVDGEYYSGYSRAHFANEDDAEKYANEFPANATLFIRHKPHRPEVSLLRRDDQMGMAAYAR